MGLGCGIAATAARQECWGGCGAGGAGLWRREVVSIGCGWLPIRPSYNDFHPLTLLCCVSKIRGCHGHFAVALLFENRRIWD